ncbi:hypothetical protein DMA11_03595 [Marinilabiliaceae bacterium JC017]|nr:hypothetical protein DMA11_03595 [Marinilabiliaceae bacterium JC017]
MVYWIPRTCRSGVYFFKNHHTQKLICCYTNSCANSDKGWLPHEISEEPIRFKNDSKAFIDEDLWESYEPAYIGPLMVGGFSLLVIISFSIGDEPWDLMATLIFYVSCILFVLCVLYYFTMPKKEMIFDRKHGTITFPGTLWNKNITMPFDKVVFICSTGGHNGIGAYQLEVLKPESMPVRGSVGLGGTCYEDLSLYTWYMDRNRPLPPGSLFDPHRERDFQRRKAEGFPPPLYPSKIPTPEATPKQQKERDKYWRDYNYRHYGTAMANKEVTPVADKWAERHG